MEKRINHLICNLENRDIGVQYSAREELIHFGALALEPLIDFIEMTPYADARGLAASALTEITGLTLAETLHWDANQWKRWWETEKNSYSHNRP